MGQALYRKYRSKSLDEIVGQEHITTSLRQAIDSDRLSHAYLFTGPRGVGKTSIARILAHEINGIPYDETQTHIDIIEIDAASNRRIDEIRDLRDKVRIAPASAKYKVYIIDEVHMLTREAFNALLKTLEEPPAHAIFILATTEAHKLPETITSRTQQFVFRPIEPTKAVEHLASIAKAEKIEIDTAALELIAAHGGGSFRDSISLLDQAGNHIGMIDAPVMRTMLGIPPDEAIDALQTVIANGDASAIITQLDAMYAQGFTAATIASRLSERLRSQLIERTATLSAAIIIDVLQKLLGTLSAAQPERYLEIVLLAVKMPLEPVSVQPTVTLKAAPEKKTEALAPKVTETPKPAPAAKAPTKKEKVEEIVPPVAEVIEAVAAPEPKPQPAPISLDDTELWQQVLERLKKQYNTLYGIIRMAQPEFGEDRTLTLTFAFAFHQKRVQESKSQKILSDIIVELGHEPLAITCLVDPDLKLAGKRPAIPAAPSAAAAPKPALAAIDDIFGSSQVL